jgi:hypothetical protein
MWRTPFQGPPFDVGFRLEQMGRVRNQPVGYPDIGFLIPDLLTSYAESVGLGVGELMPDPYNAGKFYLDDAVLPLAYDVLTSWNSICRLR